MLDTVAEDTAEEHLLSDDWKAEFDKRSAAHKFGEEKTTSWEDIKARLIRKHL